MLNRAYRERERGLLKGEGEARGVRGVGRGHPGWFVLVALLLAPWVILSATVLLVLLLVVGGGLAIGLWWKTRALRRAVRERAEAELGGRSAHPFGREFGRNGAGAGNGGKGSNGSNGYSGTESTGNVIEGESRRVEEDMLR